MQKIPIEEIIENIRAGKTFVAEELDGSFYIEIQEYAPFVCAAIHNGHRLRDELARKILLTPDQRKYEEDPFTGDFIMSLPIVLLGNDSRFEYDLNREPEHCIYDVAWGKKTWKKPLTKEEKKRSLEKHANFYRVADALISRLESLFNACIVYDIHSYNYKRLEGTPPVFNIGTANIDMKKFGKYVTQWKWQLSNITLPNIETHVRENDVFQGNGYFLKHITETFPHTLVLATEIKKIYMDEETGTSYPLVITELEDTLKNAILNHASCFAKHATSMRKIKRYKMLSSTMDRALKKIDNEMFKLLESFEILYYINPINLKQEMKAFFNSGYEHEPQFKYPQLVVDPFHFKRKLHNLPIEEIQDISIRNMYEAVIDSYTDKVDMIATIGSRTFLYNSLRYFGEPDKTDITNAEFLLYCPVIEDAEDEPLFSAKEAKHLFCLSMKEYGINGKIQLSDNIVSTALVINHKKLLLLKKDARFSIKQINSLTHHEIGVHMITTENARLHPLKIMRLGLPRNTLTQEGLAILSEYLSGTLTVSRLKELAHRVIAIRSMLRGKTFRDTFLTLRGKYKLKDEKAFALTARIYRGGGFTKDYLYLRGFRDLLRYYNSHDDKKALDSLLIGKTSVEYVDTLNEMVGRKLLNPPVHRNIIFDNPIKDTPILDYLVSGLR